jgi:hypothetical protein
MKNIHLLPTDKPSKLCIDNSCNELNYSEVEGLSSKHITNQHIYITNDEKPKSGDWCFNPKTNKIVKVGHHGHYGYSSKKIILTTDPDLIENGVQPIDDEFLEWFVKNPSCEYVEWDKNYNRGNGKFYYKIIIPQEEPKKLVGERIMPLDNDNIEEEEETLEEAAENSISQWRKEVESWGEKDNFLLNIDSESDYRLGFKNGAKWQAEQDKNKYSEEEVGELVYNIIGEYGKHYGIMIDGTKLNDLFEQFKKK